MRILIVDDHAMFRQGLSLLFSSSFENCQAMSAGDIPEALERLRECEAFDLILLDLYLPGQTGFEGIKLFHDEAPSVPVAVLSASEKYEDMMKALELGAQGYILKTSDEKTLKLAISLMLSGETYIPSGIFIGKDGAPTPAEDFNQAAKSGSPLAQLSQRQGETLNLLKKGKSNKQIAIELGVLESTIKTHIKVICRKLSVSNRTEAAALAVQYEWQSR